nr:MAG TPA: hypothetical protein [Caudoviricetes sp.]
MLMIAILAIRIETICIISTHAIYTIDKSHDNFVWFMVSYFMISW